MEKISVIVPVYNAEPYLEQCLDSILQQSYQNLEVILINDGATDGSAAICEAYKQKDSRVRVYHKENGGVASSRNRALEQVRGDYILFVDCDDWLAPDHIASLYQSLQDTGSDIAVGNFTEFHEDTALFMIHVGEKDYFQESYTSFDWFSKQYQALYNLSQCFTVPWAKLYKASLFEDVIYPTDKKVEDDYTTYKLYLKADKISYINKAIYFHRKRDTSVTRKVNLMDVYPLKSIEERMAILTLAGAPMALLEMERDAYKWRLAIHAEETLKAGDMDAYRQVLIKQAILGKARKRQVPPRLKALTVTNSQELLKMETLVEALPFVEFHIAARTAMGEKLQKLEAFGNVRLHPGASQEEIDQYIDQADIYLDVSLSGQDQAVFDQVLAKKMPSLGFYRTQNGELGQLLFSSRQPKALIAAITELDQTGHLPEAPAFPLVKSIDESLNYIWANNASVIRFGDGETNLMAGLSIPYQDFDENLAQDLKRIMALQSNKKRLICLSDVFRTRFELTPSARDFWKEHLDHYEGFYHDIATAPWYGSTFISRPYIDFEDKSQAPSHFNKLKRFWRNRDILVVEGQTTRSGVGNDLFDQARSVKRIVCPSKNAYQSLDEIEQAVLKYGKGRLILLMLGPTAKVLAYCLSEAGYQALDIGHIDSEYEWLKMGATTKVKLDHKHTAEFNYDEDIEWEEDDRYNREVVVDLSQPPETMKET